MAGGPSKMMLTQRIWIAVSGAGRPATCAPRNARIAPMFVDNWKRPRRAASRRVASCRAVPCRAGCCHPTGSPACDQAKRAGSPAPTRTTSG
jgi:hypothetical protein